MVVSTHTQPPPTLFLCEQNWGTIGRTTGDNSTRFQQQFNLLLQFLQLQGRHGLQLAFLWLHTGVNQQDGEPRAIFGDRVYRFSKNLWMGSFQLIQELLRALELRLMRVIVSTMG